MGREENPVDAGRYLLVAIILLCVCDLARTVKRCRNCDDTVRVFVAVCGSVDRLEGVLRPLRWKMGLLSCKVPEITVGAPVLLWEEALLLDLLVRRGMVQHRRFLPGNCTIGNAGVVTWCY